MSPPAHHRHVHPLRRMLRRMPRLRGLLLPIMPRMLPLIRYLDRFKYQGWLEQWQASDANDDARIIGLLGPEVPPFLVRVSGNHTQITAPLAPQAGVRFELLDTEEGLRASAAPGRFLLRLAAGDILPRHALAEFALAARQKPVPLIIFADEDTQAGRGRSHKPWFKTAFDPDLLLQQPAFGRAVAYDSGLLLRHGLLGLSGHALMLSAARAAIAEAGPEAIRHLPAILLHRAPSRVPAWREGRDVGAISAALPSGVTLHPAPQRPRIPRLVWPLPEPAPQVTVIIPTRNGTALMEACMSGLLTRTDYARMDIIICDNGSDDLALLRRFDEWSRSGRVRVLPCAGPFNYSAINNRAAREASGEILLFLNNDTEVRHADWLREMASHAIRPEIGAVGARLLFPSLRVQHSGTVLGLGGIAGHDMLHASSTSLGPYDLLRVTRRVSAVTAACLAVRREAFLAVGGFDEEGLRIAYNDVDLCLKLRAAGLQNLVTPHAELLHKESATRGDDMSPAHRARWQQERAVIRARWGDALLQDPFYSPLLSLDPPLRVLAASPRRLAPWRPVEVQPPLPD